MENTKNEKSIPPPFLVGRFFDLLLDANQTRLAGFKRWLFHPGMLFQAPQQWWGQEKLRPYPHEGLDLCCFETAAGRRLALDHTTAIPAPFPGAVVKIAPDFLGQSIFLAHGVVSADGRRLYAAFGHTTPAAGLAAGRTVQEGDIVAAVSAPVNRKTAVSPHLHVTLALIPDAFGLDQLSWNNLGHNPDVVLVDPLAVFPTTWTLLADP